ncbi:MAG: P63C domain-containing protein [Silvibacterium sp.]
MSGDESKAKGGHARAEILSPEKRSEIAKKAALARWGEKELPRATHSGSIKIGDLSLPVFVLEDGTRLIPQRAMQTTIGMSTSGGSAGAHRTAQIVERIEDKLNISNDLSVRMKSPILCVTGGLSTYGNEATTLIDVCELMLKARDGGVLTPSQQKYADAADIVIRSFAKVGIIALIDEATGYQEVRPREALQAFLEKIIAKELAAWVKTFPDEFYQNIYKLKNWPWPGMSKNRYSVVAHYTNDLVYERLAPGLRAELEKKNPRDEKGRRAVKNFQWLTSEIGHPMLAQHLYSLMMFQRLAISNGFGWKRFLKMIDQVHPKKGMTLDLPFPQDKD